ncbi:sigma-70 family RNA polymerase sigma factor [Leucobacter allii]|uniref:Sigma-70 family RNA polymerase sigma factor n=1 Tax=Leucobacter allii TaxID=2932247 RepID=A0ABY4FNP1_9MICO|nr:sigma-70 family RNA polymerase sigma factor [Leucobacter allii]UOQ57886.1 sigma-70 family RNA polymerase sigma factor [Leucobacter allii]
MTPSDRRDGTAETVRAARAARAVEAVWRIEAARIVATLTRYVGDFGLAEDLAQEALAAALREWPRSGVPGNPGAWLTTAAKRRAIDGWRRREVAERALALVADAQRAHEAEAAEEAPGDPDAIGDDVLRLVFISCHPVLSREAQLALTLRVVGGLTTAQIARAFLLPVPTVQQRIVRAKQKLAAAEVPFELPAAAERGRRLGGVLGVLYLMFSEGHVATSGPDWMRPELAMEALRLARVVAALMPAEPEVHGLVALMAYTASRFSSRIDAEGHPVLLAEQHRASWDRALIGLGDRALERADAQWARRAAGSGAAGRGDAVSGAYTLQARIAACHASAARFADTDWRRIAEIYRELCAVAPSPVAELNRAIAVAEAEGPLVGLELVERLAGERALAAGHLLPSVRGELLARLGRDDEAAAELDRAAALATNARERAVLCEKAAAVRDRDPGASGP